MPTKQLRVRAVQTRHAFVLISLMIFLAGACRSSAGTTVLPQTPTATIPGLRVHGDVNPTQQAALDELVHASTSSLEAYSTHGQIKYLAVQVHVPDSKASSAQEKAIHFLQQNEAVFQIGDASKNLKIEEKSRDVNENITLRYIQQYKGVPVFGSSFVITIGTDDQIKSISADYIPVLSIDVKPIIRSTQAEKIAVADLGGTDGQILGSTSLQIFSSSVWEEGSEIQPALVWVVKTQSKEKSRLLTYIIDAKSGDILMRINLLLELAGSIDLEIREMEQAYWGLLDRNVLVMTEAGEVSGSRSPSEFSRAAFTHITSVYDYYYDTFNRDSYDNYGEMVYLYVNIGTCSDKAYWQPENEFIYYSDGWTLPRDVTAHEFTHAVIGSEVQLMSSGQPREINEAFADIFAAFSAAETPWQINRLPDDEGRTILRNLAEPQEGYPSR